MTNKYRRLFFSQASLVTLSGLALFSDNVAAQNNQLSNARENNIRILKISSTDELIKVNPLYVGELIFAVISSDNENHADFFRSGVFAHVIDDSSESDGGVIFRANQKYVWKRLYNKEVDACWFGVRNDGVSCEREVELAIKYIAKNGGILKFPEGTVNFGSYRVALSSDEVSRSFTLSGIQNKTVIVFENLEPPVKKSKTKYWVKEPPLFSVQSMGDESLLPAIIIENLIIDYTNQRNKGGNSLDTLHETHPTPYSLGVWGIYIHGSANPVIRNVVLREIYGNGIVLKNCFHPVVQFCEGYNVSGNNILSPDGSMAKDSDGGFCFLWSCFAGLVEGCTAWNRRKYTVDFNSPENGVQLNSTLCGYIGIWAEFSLNDGDSTFPYKKDLAWLPNFDQKISSGTVFRNNIIYGYTIGIKAENHVDVSILENTVLNCYLPIYASGVKSQIIDNWIDMLDCALNKCPQQGYEFKRSCIGGSDWYKNEVLDAGTTIRNNHVHTSNYPLFLVNHSLTDVSDNHFVITKTGILFDSKESKLTRYFSIRGNVFLIKEGISNVVSRVTQNDNAIIKNNKFINTTGFIHEIKLINSDLDNVIQLESNVFSGGFSLTLGANVKLLNNTFMSLHVKDVPIINCVEGAVYFSGNDFSVNICNNSPIKIKSDNYIHLFGNSFTLVGDANSNNSKKNSLIDIRGSSYDNKIKGNYIHSNRNSTSFISCDNIEYVVVDNNYSDFPALLIDAKYKVLGPIISTNNGFSRGIVNTKLNLNSPDNLSKAFTPSIGERLYSTSPVSGDAEGIVLTENGWKLFGHIH